MAYSVRIESFEGPLDLLLQLVESQQREITSISLMEVTEPFVQHVREQQGKIPPEELADFLVVAAKLVYLKSKALLPTLSETDLDDGPDLATQLRTYKAFAEASNKLAELDRAGCVSFSRARKKLTLKPDGVILPPVGVTPSILHELYSRVIRRLEPLVRLPQAALERAVTIEEKIEQLRTRVQKLLAVSFHRVLADARDRHEMVVTFLALLELIKQKIVKIEQTDLFQDIRLQQATKEL